MNPVSTCTSSSLLQRECCDVKVLAVILLLGSVVEGDKALSRTALNDN